MLADYHIHTELCKHAEGEAAAFRTRAVDIMTLSQKYKTTPKTPVSLEDMDDVIRRTQKRMGLSI